MSDFLLGLARRSAGLAPAVQSRDLPPPDIVTAPTVDAAPPPTAVPLPAAPAPAGVIQREPLPPTVASPSAPSTPPAVVPLPPPEPGAARADAGAVVGREPVQSPVLSVTPPESELHPHALPAAATADVRVEHHTTTRVVELIPAPVTPVPRGDDNQPRPAALVRPGPTQAPSADRLVQVRIGAIEIVGPPPPAPPPAASPAAPPPARVHGFDDFSALRTYAPFTW